MAIDTCAKLLLSRGIDSTNDMKAVALRISLQRAFRIVSYGARTYDTGFHRDWNRANFGARLASGSSIDQQSRWGLKYSVVKVR